MRLKPDSGDENMKKTFICLIVCGLYAPAFAQQSVFKELEKSAGGVRISAPGDPVPSSAGSVAVRASCSIVDQSGTLDSFACRNSEGKTRCYADIDVDGTPFRVYGGCYPTHMDCWSNGVGAVKDPCDSIDEAEPRANAAFSARQTAGALDEKLRKANNKGDLPAMREVKFLFDPAGTKGGTYAVVDLGGVIDLWACRNSTGTMRCYADVITDGSSLRVYGGCWNSFSDCLWDGPGFVNPYH